MGGKCRKSRYESSSSSDSETSDSSSSDTSDSNLDTSCKHKSHHKTGRSRHQKHRKHKKIGDVDHQALIVQYHLTINIGNINIPVQNITKSINILSIQSMNNAKQIMDFTIGIESQELGMI